MRQRVEQWLPSESFKMPTFLTSQMQFVQEESVLILKIDKSLVSFYVCFYLGTCISL